MKEDEIIAMAKEAGIIHPEKVDAILVRFARLVAAHEREACAKVADEYAEQVLEHNFSKLIAHNIRQRGQA